MRSSMRLLLLVLVLLASALPASAGRWGEVRPIGEVDLILSAQQETALTLVFDGGGESALQAIVLTFAVLAGFFLNSLFNTVKSWPLRLSSVLVASLVILVPVATADIFSGGVKNNGVGEIGHNYVVFNWTNSVQTKGSVHYGPTQSMGQYAYDSGMSEYHKITVSGLSPDTKYYYELLAEEADGTVTQKSDRYYSTDLPKPWEVTTTDPPDTTSPVISSLSVIIPSSTSAQFNWVTDESSDSIVYYGSDYKLGLSEGLETSTTAHSLTINDLVSGGLYSYKVSSCDNSGNCANSSLKEFRAQIDSQQQFLATSLSTHHNAWTIAFTGTTKPFSTVDLFVNGNLKSYKEADEDGNFAFSNVKLSQDVSPNVLRLVSKDLILNEIAQEYSLLPDFDAPEMNITQFNTTSMDAQTEIKGYVDELVRMDITVHPEIDQIPPQDPTGLNATEIYTNSVELKWDDATESDFMTFILYRDGVRITNLTHTRYTDSGMDSGRTYQYELALMDESCNEGQRSDVLEVTTKEGGPTYGINATEITISCNEFSYSDSMNISGYFTLTPELTPGQNYIKIVATDAGGSSVTYENTTYYDSGEPEFISTNLGQYNGLSYERDITIEGNVSEECDLSVYLNDDLYPTATGKSEATNDPDVWSFSLDLTLSRDVEFNAKDSTPTSNWTSLFESASAWENEITLVCTDRVGNNATEEATIIYSLCSVGSWWETKVTEPMPDILTPRLLVQGMGQVGWGINLTWQGSTTYNATVTDIRIVPLAVPQDEVGDWDLGWVSGMSLAKNRNKTEAFAVVKFKALDMSKGKNWTWYEKEKNLSDNRKGECTTIPGFGCVRLPLVLEIEFQTDNPADKGQTFTQKECWVPVEIAIDERLDPGLLPESFLKKAVNFLTTLIKQIDKVIEPLKQIEKFAIYACMASWAILFYQAWSKRGACQMSQFVPGANFSTAVAKYGEEACWKTYTGDPTKNYNKQGLNCGDNNKRCDSCKTCAQSEEIYKTWENRMVWVCDRVFCPTAPTFKKFVDDHYPKSELTSSEKVLELAKEKDETIKDCDLVKNNSNIIQEYYYGSEKKNNSALYDFKTYTSGNSTSGIDCSKLHVPDKRCCPAEYMSKYDSVCGLPEGRLFDELKESACIVAQERRDTNALRDLQCNTVWNSVAGFCDPDGHKPADYVPTGIYSSPTHAVAKEIYIKIVDPSLLGSSESDNEKKWLIEAGYVDPKVIDTKNATKEGKHVEGKGNLITQQTYFLPISDSGNMNDFFVDKDGFIKDLKESCGESAKECQKKQFCQKMNTFLGTQNVTDKDQKLFLACKQVHSKLGTAKTEVVDPTSGLLRSAQCLCIPAFKSYLSLYRAMADAVRSCFSSILLTGDGEAGVCQAVLTTYICDLIWDLIRCFKDSFTYVPGKEKGGFGSVVARITGAADDMSNSVGSRYGDTAPWKAMFAEKKVVHALCLWAFTGTWSLDITSFFESNFSIPIESQGLLLPCDRRFVGFDPSSSPSGKPIYVYHVGAGLVAGAELTNVHLDLVCSNGLCESSKGFTDGLCDCRSGQQSANAGWSGIESNMDPGEVLSEDVYVQKTGYRYDKAALYWTYTNNKNEIITTSANCSIRKVGADEPAYCQWSFVYGQYLCDFGGGDDCVGFFNANPYVVVGNDYVDKELMFRASISHGGGMNETDSVNRCTKFVQVVVENTETHYVVYTSSKDAHKINFNGTMELEIPTKIIEKSWLSGNSGTHMISQDNNGIVKATVGNPSNPGNYRIAVSNGAYSCLKYSSSDKTCTSSYETISLSLSGSTVVCNGNTFEINPYTSTTASQSDCLVLSQNTASSARSCETNNPYTNFKATFTMYDSIEYGSSWVADSNKVSSYDGKTQKREINFQLKCTGTSGTGGTGTSPKMSFTIDNGQTSLDIPNGVEKEIKIVITSDSAPSSVKLKEGNTFKSDSFTAEGQQLTYTMKYKDWQADTTYKALVTVGGVDYESNGVLINPAKKGGIDCTGSQPSTTIDSTYCENDWKTVAGFKCSWDYFLTSETKDNTVTITCYKYDKVKDANTQVGSAQTYDRTKTCPDWGKTYQTCKDQEFAIKT